MAARVGVFFLLVGILVMLLFVASDLAGVPNYNLFFLGILGIVVGILMIRRGWKPAQSSGRFRMLQRFSRKRDSKE